MLDEAKLFNVIREIKDKPLTQDDVNKVNAVLHPNPIIAPIPSGSGPKKIGTKGTNLIHSFETLKLTAYKDPGSKNGLPITNGWGTTVDEDGGPIRLGAQWDEAKADRLFRRDIATRENQLNKLLGNTPTTQNQFDALMSLGYNIGFGEGGLKTSTLLRMHMAGDYAGAKEQFKRWNKNDGKVMNGLIRRRAAEAELYGTP